MKRSRHTVTLTCPALAAAWLLLGCQPATAQVTSKNNNRLKRALEQYPQADADGDGVLTLAEANVYRAKLNRPGKPGAQRAMGPPPAHENLSYGPHERNVLDLWLAESQGPAPLVVCIHGGGFQGGDKKKFRQRGMVEGLLQRGISVAAINYRLTDGGRNPFPAPMHDGARAVQFLRYHAKEYNLDKNRVAAVGGSAGGCMSLWLAFHDDLADKDNKDPVLRESTRLTCAGPGGGQSTLDKQTFQEWFQCDNLQEHGGGRPLFDIRSDEDINSPRVRDLMREASPIKHLDKDDPPVYLTYGQRDVPVDENTPPGVWVHHPRLGIKLKERMDALRVECHVQYPGGPPVTAHRSQTDFIVTKLLQE